MLSEAEGKEKEKEKEKEKGIGGAEGTRIGCEQSVPGAASNNADPQNAAELPRLNFTPSSSPHPDHRARLTLRFIVPLHAGHAEHAGQWSTSSFSCESTNAY